MENPRQIIWENKSFEGEFVPMWKIEKVSIDDVSLIVELKDRSNVSAETIKITFERISGPFAYRFTNESYLLDTWNISKSPSPISGLRYTTASPYIDWLNAENRGVNDCLGMKHFLLGDDDVLEILTKDDPTFESVS